jgi:hypothetical protein
MMKSEAWRSLSPAERCTYIEIERHYFGLGSNNGRIGLSARAVASACNMSKDTANKAFRRLSELGFIECATPGSFHRKSAHAAEWRLTRVRCDVTGALPSKAFMKWLAPAKANAERGPKSGTERSKKKDS